MLLRLRISLGQVYAGKFPVQRPQVQENAVGENLAERPERSQLFLDL